MFDNYNKRDAYKLVLSRLKNISNSSDVFQLVGLVASCESIILDRLTAYLVGTKNFKYESKSKNNKHVSFSELLQLCKLELQLSNQINTKTSCLINSKNLFAELMEWKEQRNKFIHSVCKSNSNISHKSLIKIYDEVFNCCTYGYYLVRLTLKWSDQTKRNYNKLKN